MTQYDIFNGDADGLCALQQLRLAEPMESVLVTGVKRDIALLLRVEATAGDRLTVLDVSLEKNLGPLSRLLKLGATVRYFDHHYPGSEIPVHTALETYIDAAPDKCTSLLVDDYLGGTHRAWAIVGAFGDNIDATARVVAEPLGLTETDLARLRALGIYLNYNGYGATVEDLHFSPAALFERLHPYSNPLDFINSDSTFSLLQAGYEDDMAHAGELSPELETNRHGLYLLPVQAWARRVSGVFANRLAQAEPDRAHALLSRVQGGGFVVSVRAPLKRREGADTLCRAFPTGGGRKSAAGINHLPEDLYDEFVKAFNKAF